MFNARVRVGFGRGCFTNSRCCEAVSRQRISSGYVYKWCFILIPEFNSKQRWRKQSFKSRLVWT